MSLARTALRIAAVMALSNGFAAPWPTMAGGRVFDSRADPGQMVDLDDVLPFVEVCTDDGRGTSLSQNNGGPPFENEVTLAITIGMGMLGESVDAGGKFLGMAQSEPELEAMLDLLERQVQRALVDLTNPWALEFQRLCRRMSDWSSTRYVERDSNVRLAARSIAASVHLPHEELVLMAPASGVPAPLGPLLETIGASTSPYASAATALRDLLLGAGASQTIALPPLLRVRFIEAEQAEENGAGVPRGPRPDGVAQADLPMI